MTVYSMIESNSGADTVWRLPALGKQNGALETAERGRLV